MGKESSTSNAKITKYSCAKKNDIEILPHITYKSKFKKGKELNVKGQTIKLLEENIWVGGTFKMAEE